MTMDPCPPPCFVLVVPGLEGVAAEEIRNELGGEIRKTSRGLVVFRVPNLDTSLLSLSTVEDCFLLAWGTDKLTYRAEDLRSFRRWTEREADWKNLLRIHHTIRPKPKGKPTYHLVAQMIGRHGYRRVDALKVLASGLAGWLPPSWRAVEENAAVEIWLSIDGPRAVCGLRLSDRTMRHRTYKREHRPASLRPTVAAAMVRLAEVDRGQVFLDPMCGVGTILAEALSHARRRGLERIQVWGGDRDPAALRAAAGNLGRIRPSLLCTWDAIQLPLAAATVDRIVSNPPFGKQLNPEENVGPLYQRMLREYNRVLWPGGRGVFLVSDYPGLRQAARAVGWNLLQQLKVRVLGQAAVISVWRKPG